MADYNSQGRKLIARRPCSEMAAAMAAVDARKLEIKQSQRAKSKAPRELIGSIRSRVLTKGVNDSETFSEFIIYVQKYCKFQNYISPEQIVLKTFWNTLNHLHIN